jgi:hypothetical protein
LVSQQDKAENFEAVKFLGEEKCIRGGLGIGQRLSPPVKPAQQAAAHDCTSKDTLFKGVNLKKTK